jgi:putative ABC transport system permease protein
VTLTRLVWRSIAGNLFRSLVVFLCAAAAAGLTVAAADVVRDADARLQAALGRLGADIIVVPWGSSADRIDGLQAVSIPVSGWMPRSIMARLRAIPGVVAVAPQLVVSRVPDAAGAEVTVVAYDPVAEREVRPWLAAALPAGPSRGEAVIGSEVVAADGVVIVHGLRLGVAKRLTGSGTDVDRAVFVSFETAADVMAAAVAAGSAISVAPDSLTMVLIRVGLGSDPHLVAVDVMERVRGVIPLESAKLYQTERAHLVGLLRIVLGGLAFTGLLALAVVGLVTWMSVNARRREIAVLRALGAGPMLIVRALAYESLLLATAGAAAGVLLAMAVVWSRATPAPATVAQAAVRPLTAAAPAVVLGIGATLVGVLAAISLPVSRAARMDPATAMRE